MSKNGQPIRCGERIYIPGLTEARRKTNMPVEPPRKISETQTIRREEGPTLEQRKKQNPKKKDQNKEPIKSGKVDIKI
jgi:hypothetical protein